MDQMYHGKYLKYKTKYQDLKMQQGGVITSLDGFYIYFGKDDEVKSLCHKSKEMGTIPSVAEINKIFRTNEKVCYRLDLTRDNDRDNKKVILVEGAYKNLKRKLNKKEYVSVETQVALKRIFRSSPTDKYNDYVRQLDEKVSKLTTRAEVLKFQNDFDKLLSDMGVKALGDNQDHNKLSETYKLVLQRMLVQFDSVKESDLRETIKDSEQLKLTKGDNAPKEIILEESINNFVDEADRKKIKNISELLNQVYGLNAYVVVNINKTGTNKCLYASV
jgi:hypothetical protein